MAQLKSGSTVCGELIVTQAGLVDHYSKGNILGTVSQSGGVPTGAVIEKGSNANGEYVKFADGTLICWKKTLNIANTDLLGFSPFGSTGLYFGAYEWTLPVAFSSEPTVTCLGGNLSAGSCFGAKYGGSSGTIANIGIYTPSSTFTGSNIGLLAIGRWF